MIDASIPPITRKISAYPMYRMPNRLWSTVVTHSCSLSTSGRSASCDPGHAIESVDIGHSPQKSQRSVSR